MEITKESIPSNDLYSGTTVVSDSARVKVVPELFRTDKGVMVVAHPMNSGLIYIGGPSVTNTGAATDGIALGASMGMVIPIEDPTRLYAIADTPGQKIGWLGV